MFDKDTAAKAGAKSSRKGVENKATGEIREAFKLLVEKQVPKLDAWVTEIAKKDPAKALGLIVKLSDFIIPRLSRIETKDLTSIEQMLRMSPEEREARIKRIKEQLNGD